MSFILSLSLALETSKAARHVKFIWIILSFGALGCLLQYALESQLPNESDTLCFSHSFLPRIPKHQRSVIFAFLHFSEETQDKVLDNLTHKMHQLIQSQTVQGMLLQINIFSFLVHALKRYESHRTIRGIWKLIKM